MLDVYVYSPDYHYDWNALIKDSRNGTFLFEREFMEYHAGRFDDFSLLVYDEKKCLAVLPAHRIENKLYSHKGLTYGGLIVRKSLKFAKVAICMRSIMTYLDSRKIDEFEVTLTPYIYHQQPSDDLVYILHELEAKLVRKQLNTTVRTAAYQLQSNRKEGVKKAVKQGLEIREDQDLRPFWQDILVPNLKNRYQTQPVHSEEEIQFLKSKFPNQIRQFSVYQGNQMVAGATLFVMDRVVHVQYIASDTNRQQLGGLDYLFDYLISIVFAAIPYFDFGTSHDNSSKGINMNLLYWKECFGGRGVGQDTYRVITKNADKLSIFE